MGRIMEALLEAAVKILSEPKVWEKLTDAEKACVLSPTHTPLMEILLLKLAAIQVRINRFDLGLGKELAAHSEAEVMLRTMLVDKELLFWAEHDRKKEEFYTKSPKKKGGK
jgi:hypothetical protein